MPAALPVPIAFSLPEGPLPARPDGVGTDAVAFAAVHPRPDAGYAAGITVDGGVPAGSQTLADLSDASVERLRDRTGPVEVWSTAARSAPRTHRP